MADELSCTKCTAPLPAGAASFSVVCLACGQWHLIDRTGAAPVARPFEEIPGEPVERPPPDESTEGGSIEQQQRNEEEIARLDQAWEWERKRYLVFGVQGGDSEPTIPEGLITGGLVSGLGGLLFFQASLSNFGERVLGLALVAAGLAFAGYRVKQALAYQDAFRRYQRQRQISQGTRTE